MNQPWRRVATMALTCACFLLPATGTRAVDEPKPAQPTEGAGRGEAAAGFLKAARAKLDELNPTAEQKTKWDEIFANAETDMKRAFADAAAADPQERRQKMMGFMTGLREKVAATLTDEQKPKFEQIQFGPGGRAGARPQLGERFKEVMDKLDLTEEQKAKVKPIMEEQRKKMEGLRAEAQSGDRQAMRQKAMAMMEETRTKLQEVLTPEQQQKFRELMVEQARPGAGGARRAGAGATEAPKPESK